MNLMIYNELKELNSPLAAISNKNIFSVPEGYFDALPQDILQGIHNEYRIKDLDIPALDRKVPQGYFDGLADVIINKIKQEEEAAVLLESIGKKNVFTVPAGYFDQLAENIKSRLGDQPARVIEMKPRSNVFKYAAAACISGIIGLSLFSILDNKQAVEPSLQSGIFVKAQEILKTNSFDKTMESLGDDEIVGYLENNTADVDAVLVASLVDEKTLPDREAYYIDEKTLDNFLSEQNIATPASN